MLYLRTLGSLDLRRDGSRIGSVLAQPKRAALLVYLTLCGEPGYIRRDVLLAHFWPESDEQSARHSLSQALHRLRQALGHDVVETRGYHDVRLPPGAVDCDARDLRSAVQESRWADALALYHGEFLAGLHISGADGFERWAAQERERLRGEVARAAWALAGDQVRRGALDEAERTASRACELSAPDEPAARSLMEQMAEAGAPAAALRFFSKLSASLSDELGVAPSAETRALAEAIRAANSASAAPSMRTYSPGDDRPPLALGTWPDHEQVQEADVAVRSPEESVTGSTDRQAVDLVVPVRGPRIMRARRLGSLAFTGAVVLVIVAVFGMKQLRPEPVDARVRSLLILPFDYIGPDPAEEYLAHGTYTGIMAELAQLSALRLISRTSALHYKNSGMSAEQIANEAGVDAIVEATIMRSADTIRMHVQLVAMLPERHLWGEEFEQDVVEARRLHTDVAAAILAELQVRVLPKEQERLTSVSAIDHRAYEAWLRGSYHASRRRGPDLEECVRQARQALTIDPGYAAAYELIARCYNVMAFVTTSPPKMMFDSAKHAARRAIELDPDLAAAHATLAYAIAHYDWNWAAAEREYWRAVELAPGIGSSHEDIAWLLAWTERYDEALGHARRAQELDPVSPQATLRVSMILHLARRHEEALAEAERAVELDPQFMFGYDRLHWAYHGLARHAEALAAAEKAAYLGGSSDVRRRGFLAYAYGLADRTGEARVILDELLKLEAQTYVPPTAIAAAYLGVGEKARALDWLERGFTGRDGDMVLLKTFPLWDPLRGEARFEQLVRRMEFPSHRRSASR